MSVSHQELTLFLVHEMNYNNQDMMDIDQEQEEQENPVASPSRHRGALAKEEDSWLTETHPTAGRVIRMEEMVHAKWRTQFGLGDRGEEAGSESSDDEDDTLFYPFASHLDWQVACWAVQEGIGHKAFDRLLAIPGVGQLIFFQVISLS